MYSRALSIACLSGFLQTFYEEKKLFLNSMIKHCDIASCQLWTTQTHNKDTASFLISSKINIYLSSTPPVQDKRYIR